MVGASSTYYRHGVKSLHAGFEASFGWGGQHHTTDARVLVGPPAPTTGWAPNTPRIQMLRCFIKCGWLALAGEHQGDGHGALGERMGTKGMASTGIVTKGTVTKGVVD